MTGRRVLAAALVLACLAPAATAAAEPEGAAGGDNTAVAVNTKDGHDVFRLAFHVHRVASETVDSTNAALAFASCNDCQTVAVAIQVVLVMSDPMVITPENVALAINQGCSLCDTVASAYQLVLSTGGPVRFTPEGRRRIAEIRRQLHELRNSGLTGEEILARVRALTAELRHVVATQLVPAGRAGSGLRRGDDAPGSEVGSTTTTTAGLRGNATSTTSTTSRLTTSTTTRPSTTTIAR